MLCRLNRWSRGSSLAVPEALPASSATLRSFNIYPQPCPPGCSYIDPAPGQFAQKAFLTVLQLTTAKAIRDGELEPGTKWKTWRLHSGYYKVRARWCGGRAGGFNCRKRGCQKAWGGGAA